MSAAIEKKKAEVTVYIGSDQVCQEEYRVLVHATNPMDWPVREFCRVPIFVQGHKFYLRSRYPGNHPYAMTYELWPWPSNLHEHSSESVTYDAEYVRERNRDARSAKGLNLLFALALPLYPFLGLFWAGFKNRVLRPAGFEPRAISKLSVFLVFNLAFLQAIFAGYLGGGALTYFLGSRGFWALDWIVLAVLSCDTVLRFSQSLKTDVQDPWGFCEWLLPSAWARNPAY